MMSFTRKLNPFFFPALLLAALALMFCEPGNSLNPGTPNPSDSETGKVARIRILEKPDQLLPTDTGLVRLSVVDSADTTSPLKGAKLTLSSTQFTLLSATTGKPFASDSIVIPDDGLISFRIFSPTTGTSSVIARVTSGTRLRSASFSVQVTEKPVKPEVSENFPKQLLPKDTTSISFTVVADSTSKGLANAVVTLSSDVFQIFRTGSADTFSVDTTGTDGKVSLRLLAPAASPDHGTLQIRIRSAAGMVNTRSFNLTVKQDQSVDRPRQMVFTAMRSTLRADGSDSTELRVLIKDDNNNPMEGEKITFTSTGGLVKAAGVTDEWGRTSTVLVSERVNRSVIVTATLVKTGATAQQIVTFDGITIDIHSGKRILMKDGIDPVVFELKDGSGNPMAGDSMEIVVKGADKGFAQSGKDSLIIITDTRGMYTSNVTCGREQTVYITAKALGARSVDTVDFTTNSLSLSSSKPSIQGDGSDKTALIATVQDGNGAAIKNTELRWTTTFGTFTSTPFSRTDASGQSQIVLQSSAGSGLAIVNVEAYTVSGNTRTLLASGNITVRVTALKVKRLTMKITPDNIPVKIGEARLIAQAFDSTDNIMNNVLIGFRLIKGAGGGDETISPPVSYSQLGVAQATFKAGQVISFFNSVRVAAVALDISGTDTLVIASSDTVGLTISGPPHKISVGANIEKGNNPNDGTFGLPTAAVVTDVNGNLVADGTPVNFGLHPVMAWRKYIVWAPASDVQTSVAWVADTVFVDDLPWTDYNNNGKLDPGEPTSDFNPANPARGEDKDGDGQILVGPDSYVDVNGDGLWTESGAEPIFTRTTTDSTGTRTESFFKDLNGDGKYTSMEPFRKNKTGPLITDLSQGVCRCTGQRDSVTNKLYEETYFGSPVNRPYPGYSSVGIDKQVATIGGKALTEIVYVQTEATFITVRITAESNGIKNSVDVRLPIVSDK